MALTLRDKKNEAKKKKKPLRDIMATPYKDYWPLMSKDEDIEELTTVLNSALVRLIEPKCPVPWELLKNEPQEKRKEIREKYRIKLGFLRLATAENARNFIVMGINQVTYLLEQDMAEAILISADVDPHHMVRHIIDMAVWRNVPVLVVPLLKEISLTTIGCYCVIIAFKKTGENGSPYLQITEKIKEINERMPAPSDHINALRQQKAKDKKSEEEPSVIEVIELDDSSNDEERKNVFLSKIPNGKAFVPALSTASAERKGIQVESEQFVSLTDSPTDFIPFESETSQKNVNKKKISYKSLLVRTVTGDPNRSDKKIANVKSNSL